MPFLCCWKRAEEEEGDTEELREARVGLRSKRPGPPVVGLAPPLSSLCSYRSAEHLAPPEREEEGCLAREGSPGVALARDLGEAASPGPATSGLDLSAGLDWTGGGTLQEDGEVLLAPPHLSPSLLGADSSHINYYDESKDPFDESYNGAEEATPRKENDLKSNESAQGKGESTAMEGDGESFTTSPIQSTSLLPHLSSTASSPPPLPPKARHLHPPSPAAPSSLPTTPPSASTSPSVISAPESSPLSTQHYVVVPAAPLPTSTSLPSTSPPALPTSPSLPSTSPPALPTSPSPLPTSPSLPSTGAGLSATNFSSPSVVLTAVRMVGSSASLHCS